MVREIRRISRILDQNGFEIGAQRLAKFAGKLHRNRLIPAEIDETEYFQHSNFTYWPDERTVLVKDEKRRLSQTENAVLKLLTEHVGKVVTFADFAEEVFHANGVGLTFVGNETKTYIMYLRRKLGEPVGVKEKESCIRTVRGEGYMLSDK